MNKIYLVKTDDLSYDYYDSFVVIAKNEEEAIKLCEEEAGNFNKLNTTIIEIIPDNPRIVLGSFNAG